MVSHVETKTPAMNAGAQSDFLAVARRPWCENLEAVLPTKGCQAVAGATVIGTSVWRGRHLTKMKNNDRIVFRREDGSWINKRLGADRASSTHRTQSAADTAAAEMLRRSGGGERITKGLDGRIRSKDTIAPGNESSRRDTEH